MFSSCICSLVFYKDAEGIKSTALVLFSPYRDLCFRKGHCCEVCCYYGYKCSAGERQIHPETWRKVSILLWLISNLFHSGGGMPTRLALSAVSGSSWVQSTVKGLGRFFWRSKGLLMAVPVEVTALANCTLCRGCLRWWPWGLLSGYSQFGEVTVTREPSGRKASSGGGSSCCRSLYWLLWGYFSLFYKLLATCIFLSLGFCPEIRSLLLLIAKGYLTAKYLGPDLFPIFLLALVAPPYP